MVTGSGGSPRVRTFAGPSASPVAEFLAYDAAFAGGVFVAVGQLTSPGDPQIVSGPGPGAAPEIRTFWPDGGAFGVTFMAYEDSFLGGVRVASCDVDGDGLAEIITAPGFGRAPLLKIWKVEATVARELSSFLVDDASVARGAFVACGDVDGDGNAELVTGLDAGGQAEIRVWKLGAGPATELVRFVAFASAFTGGVRVATADVDGDGRSEIVAGQGPGGEAKVRVFHVAGTAVSMLAAFGAVDVGVTEGVFVAGTDVDGDARMEVIAGVDSTVHVFAVGDTGAVWVTTLAPPDAATPIDVPVAASR
jgi:hypothetical protein